MNKIGIIGAGSMGSGIAQVAALNGCDVVLVDLNQEALQKALKQIQKILNRLAEKGTISNEHAVQAMGNIHMSQNIQSLSDTDLVLEAIIENIEVKNKVFDELEDKINENTIVASNTSSLSITEMATRRKRPQNFLGIHFFNPPGLMKLVEIIPAVQTDTDIVKKAEKLIKSWGKITVKAQDSPGFIVNKVARPFYSEAIKILEEGTADIATIDKAMTNLGFKMGPFTLMDYIGHDVNYAVTESVWKAFYYDDRYTPSFSQKRLVQAGYLGKKTLRGFYDYREGAQLPEASDQEALLDYIGNRILCMLINEAADTVSKGICSEEDVDLAVLYGVNYPKGLLAWSEEMGVDHIVKTLDNLYARYHESRYRVSPYLRDRAFIYSQADAT